MGAANVSMNMQDNPYVPFPSKILEVIRHTQKEYTFRMEFVGDVKPGQFFEVRRSPDLCQRYRRELR